MIFLLNFLDLGPCNFLWFLMDDRTGLLLHGVGIHDGGAEIERAIVSLQSLKLCFELVDIIYKHLGFIFDDGGSGKLGIFDRVNAVIVLFFKLDYHFG